MCNYQSASVNSYGYVISYNCCKGIELAFYTTVVRMNKDRLEKLFYELMEILVETDPGSDQNVKRFGVSKDTNTRMALTYFELKQLVGMLEESRLILQAYDIIES